MATVAPGAEYQQLPGKSRTPLTHDIVCVHTMVGTLLGSVAWSARPGNSYWHFGLGGGGRLIQCQDLDFRSAANLNGNWHVIPIETADMDEGHFPSPWANPPWTPAQIARLIDLIAWLCVRYNIPPVLIPDTRPGRRGLAYHRQGIDPWRVSGGELWSSADGKVCPAARIEQFINIVIPAVAAKVAGKPPDEEEDMPVVSHARDARNGAIWEIVNFSTRRWLSSTRQVEISKIYWASKGVKVDASGDWSPEDIDDKGIVPGTPVPAGTPTKQFVATNEDIAWAVDQLRPAEPPPLTG